MTGFSDSEIVRESLLHEVLESLGWDRVTDE